MNVKCDLCDKHPSATTLKLLTKRVTLLRPLQRLKVQFHLVPEHVNTRLHGGLWIWILRTRWIKKIIFCYALNHKKSFKTSKECLNLRTFHLSKSFSIFTDYDYICVANAVLLSRKLNSLACLRSRKQSYSGRTELVFNIYSRWSGGCLELFVVIPGLVLKSFVSWQYLFRD